MLDPNFVILGSLINLSSAFVYLFATVRGEVKPNRVTFFLWALVSFIAFAAQVKQGVGIQSLFTLFSGLIPLSILIASFVNKKSFWKLGTFDYICGALSLIGLLLWYITKVGNIAIFCSILADAFAYIPTLRKSYYFPETENGLSYFLSATGAAITALTITVWNFQTYAFPIYVFILDFVIFILVQFKVRRLLKKFIL
ncbi:MAG: hypothetical protein ABH816_00010 [Candidatus Levyibacteriota bacterium]